MSLRTLYDEASLWMTPSGYEDGKLFSELPTDGSGDFTFSRGSNLAATRVGPTGLIEKGRENLLLQSNQFDTTWVNSNTAETGGQSGYDGTNDAWLLTATGSPSAQINQNKSFSGVHTFSVYAKAGTADFVELVTIGGGGANPRSWFNLSTGSVGTSYNCIDTKIEAVSGGWYRCSITLNANITNYRVYLSDSDNSTAVTIGNYIVIQDAQLEAGLVATDYIETGASTAQAGILEDMPRLDYSGGASCPALLLEPQRTNLLTYSEYFSAWGNTATNVLANHSQSPEGLNNAFLLYPASDGNYRDKTLQSTGSSGDYTFSCFIKSSGKRWAYFRNYFASNIAVHFDLQNGIVGTEQSGYTGKIENFGNGWYRCSMSSNFTGSNPWGVVGASDADNSPAVLVNGTDGILVYGAQLESGSYPTSYIPNHSGGSVTRGVDNLTSTNLSIDGLFGPTSGSIFMEFTNPLQGLNNNWFYMTGVAAGALAYMRVRGYWQMNIPQLTWNPNPNLGNTDGATKIAVKWGDGIAKLFIDGAEDAAATYTGGDINMNIYLNGINGDFNFAANDANFKQILFFPEALSDSECIALTKI